MIFRFLILAFLLLSCSQKETQQRTHELEKPTTVPWSMGGERNCKIDFKMFHLDEKICELDIASASLEQLKQLQTLIYSDVFLQNPTITSSDYFLRMQWQVNAVLEKEYVPQHLQVFIDTITRDCGNVDLRECRNFAFLKVATNSYEVLLKYLNDDSNKNKLELIYLLAANIKNSTNDIRLIQTFARRHQDFTASDSLRSLLAIDLQMNGPQLNSTERNAIRQYIQNGLRSLKDVQTRQELDRYISAESTRLGDRLLTRRLEKLAQKRPALLRSLNLTTQFSDDQRGIFFILDLVYWKYLQDRDELTVLRRLYSEDIIVRATKMYFQLLLALEINDSDLAVKNVMSNLRSQTSQLLQKFTEDIDVVRSRWQIFQGSCQTLASWVKVSLLLDPNRDAINKLVAGVDISIRAYSELPHNFYLALYLAKTNFDSRQDLKGLRSDAITALTVFSELISPKDTDQSWLRYTNDARLLNSYLVKNSLAFLFRSQLLQILGEDQEEFLRYFVKSIRNRYLDDTTRKINLVKTFLTSGRRAREFFTFCTAYNGTGSVERRLRLVDLPEGVLFPTFDKKTFIIMNGFDMLDSVAGSSPDPTLMPFGSRDFADMYEHIITDTEVVIDLYNLILRSLAETGQDSKYLRAEREQVTRHQTEVITLFKSWNRMGDCMAKVFSEEQKIREFAIGEEKKYLARVYRDLVFLRQHPSEIEVVRSRYKDTLFLEELADRHVQPLDSLSVDGYIYSRFDFLARMTSYLKKYSTKLRYIIELPETIETSDVYSYSSRTKTPTFLSLFVTETMTEDEFIQSAMRLYWGYGSFTRWTGNDQVMIDVYSEYIKNLAGQLRTGSVEIPEFLTKFQLFADFLRIKNHQREILQANSELRTYGLVKFLQMFLDYNQSEFVVTRLYGIFDMPYKFVMEDILGKDYFVKYTTEITDTSLSTGSTEGLNAMKTGRKGPRARAEFLTESMKNLDKKLLLFPLSNQIVEDEYAAIKRKLREQEKLQSDFLQGINSVNLSDYYIDISINLSITGPQLSPPLVRSYRAEVGNFHMRTQDCFRADKNCLRLFLENEITSSGVSSEDRR